MQPRLFDPLEIDRPYWQSDPDGIELGGTGLFLKTLDIAKLGQLYLQKGRWKGKQILSEAWIEQATSLQTSNGSNPESDWDQGYGYQFWRCRHNLYRGDGAFGQYCIVMPEQDAVVAITSGSSDMQGIMNLVWDHLLPAMQDKALQTDKEAHNALNSRLELLALSPVAGEESQPIASVISGKKYILEQNPQRIHAFALNIDQDEKSATFWTDEGEQSFAIGYQTMLKGSFVITGMGNVKTACSGAWISEDTYKMMTYNYETPQAVIYEIKFDGNSIVIDSRFNVSRGNDQLQMRGVME